MADTAQAGEAPAGDAPPAKDAANGGPPGVDQPDSGAGTSTSGGDKRRSPPRDRGGRDRSRNRDRRSPPRGGRRSPPRRRSPRRGRSPPYRRDRRGSPRRSRDRSPRRRGGRDRSRSPMGGGHRGRGGRSPSPPQRRRKKKKSLWDQAPTEAEAAAQAAASAAAAAGGGVNALGVPMPDGAGNSLMMGRGALASAGLGGGAIPGGAAQGSDVMHVTRQARRLYVGNLPFGAQQEDLRNFFNGVMTEAQGPNRNPGDSVLSVYINHQRRFAFAEFRTMEEATSAMALDGISYQGESLKIGRPANYNPAMLPQQQQDALRNIKPLNIAKLGIVSSQVPDGPNKIFCGGLPYELSEDQVKELLQTYSPLKAFHLVKDQQTNVSKGFCFFEYADSSVTQDAITGLNGIQIGDRTLTVRRHTPQGERHNPNQMGMGNANPLNAGLSSLLNPMLAALAGRGRGAPNGGGPSGAPGMPGGPPMMGGMGGPPAMMGRGGPPMPGHGGPPPMPGQGGPMGPGGNMNPHGRPSTVLELSNMVVEHELRDPQTYQEILEDVRLECSNHGQVRTVDIPKQGPGMCKVYVEFGMVDHAIAARRALEGRTFDQRTVMVRFVDPMKFQQRMYHML